MKKLMQKILFFFWLLSFVSKALATDLVEIYEQALTNDQVFQAAKAMRLSKQEALPQARANLLPNLNGTISSTQNYYRILNASDLTNAGLLTNQSDSNFEYSSTGYTLNLSQPLIDFGKWMQVYQASAEVKKAEAEFGAAAQDLIIRVARAYLNILFAADNLKIARAETEDNARQYTEAKKRFEVGLVPVTTVYDAQASFDRAAAQEITAANILRNNAEAIRQLTGSTYAIIDEFKVVLPLLSPVPADIQQWLDASAKYNLNLLTERYATESARHKIKVNYSGHLPSVNFVGSYSRNNGTNFGTVDVNQSTVGVQVNVPLFQGGLVNSQTRQAEADYVNASANREDTYRSVIVVTRQKYNDVLAGIDKIKADRQTVSSTQSSLNGTEEQYKMGTTTIVDVLIARRNLYDAKRNLVADQYKYLLDTLLLKQSTGILAPKDLQAINQWLHAEKPIFNKKHIPARKKITK